MIYPFGFQPGVVFCDDPEHAKQYYQQTLNPDGTIGYIPTISPQKQESLMYETARSQILLEFENKRREEEEASKKRIEQFKSELMEKQLEGMARRKELRELAQLSVFLNSDGEMVLQRTKSNNEVEISSGIINAENLQISLVKVAGGNESIEMITYDGCKKPLILKGDNCCSDGFIKQLKKCGIAVKLSSALTAKVEELIYAHLKTNAKEVIIPAHFGWNKTEDGWYFADETEETYEDLCHETDSV